MCAERKKMQVEIRQLCSEVKSVQIRVRKGKSSIEITFKLPQLHTSFVVQDY